MLNNCIVVPNSLVRKSIFDTAGLFNTNIQGAEDYDMWIRIAKLGLLVHIPEPLFCYRIHVCILTCFTRKGFTRKGFRVKMVSYVK